MSSEHVFRLQDQQASLETKVENSFCFPEQFFKFPEQELDGLPEQELDGLPEHELGDLLKNRKPRWHERNRPAAKLMNRLVASDQLGIWQAAVVHAIERSYNQSWQIQPTITQLLGNSYPTEHIDTRDILQRALQFQEINFRHHRVPLTHARTFDWLFRGFSENVIV